MIFDNKLFQIFDHMINFYNAPMHILDSFKLLFQPNIISQNNENSISPWSIFIS